MALELTIGQDAPEVRSVVTPEGVPLLLSLASLGERVAAFALDLTVIIALLILVALVGLAAGLLGIGADFFAAFASAAAFATINLYFVWFELRSSGRTPGKKALGIRVLSRSGGPLRADAVIARNLTRDVEFFAPIALIALNEHLLPETSVVGWALACAWLIVLALVPAFNRDRLRVGDVIAGTWVVRSPQAVLERDLARRATASKARARAAAAAPAHVFTAPQLEVYGVFELQALEDVLRARTRDAARLRAAVAEKIVRKIGYEPGPRLDADHFLRDFYAALRAHLERRMLFGERKDRKDS
jgi:uncharacterized RDD family membrane protein YckC